MAFGSLTSSFRMQPPGTRTVFADRVGGTKSQGGWMIVLAQYPSGLSLPWHAHEHEESFHLTVRGLSDERYWKISRGKLAGTAQFYGQGVGHQTRFGPDGALVLHVGRDAIGDGAKPAPDPIAEPDPKPMLDILRAIRSGDTAALLDIETATDRLARSFMGTRDTCSSETSWPAWLTRMRERLFALPQSEVGLTAIAREEGLNPSHMGRVFRDRLGMTAGEFIRRRRLQLAADTLVTTRRSIASIAHDAGFCDQSHFGRAFRDRYGTTPGLFRRECR